jgi:DNA repair protein RAD7
MIPYALFPPLTSLVLQSHNISATRIAADHARRVRDAQQDQAASSSSTAAAPPNADEADESDDDNAEAVKRKKNQRMAIEKIKNSKKFKKRKRDFDDDMDDDDIAQAIFEASKAPLPGQMDNCAECGTRFTVTPYSRAAPDGGLLCTPCGKSLDAEDAGVKKTKRKARVSNGPVGRRRTQQSSILDGTYGHGPKALVTLCVETLAKNIDLADDLGALPDKVVDRIACLLSKRRLLNSKTVNLFLQPEREELKIYDAATLSSDDFVRIFQMMPALKRLRIRNAIHFKDDVMSYMLTRNLEMEALALLGANLISEKKWCEFLTKQGKSLLSLKISFTDKHVTDKVMAAIGKSCKSLTQLKICHNEQVTGAGVTHITKLKTIERLALQLKNMVHSDVYVKVLNSVGPNLQALSLRVVAEADNTILDALHHNCTKLRKLRITDSECMTDEGFVRLFSGWQNRPLEYLDLEACRHLDSTQRIDNPDGIGLCSEGFKAIMQHSGKKIQHLNVCSCRHIKAAAFEEVFALGTEYPELRYFNISFCAEVTDFVVGLIFRACPKLREMVVFGCMKVKAVRVPRGKILVGVPNAIGMRVEGEDSDVEM